MDTPTLAWWSSLAAVSALNLLAWLVSFVVLRRRRELLRPVTRTALRVQLALSAGYVAGCAYRSLFPVFDIQRQVLVDSWLSSVIVGRSVATVAELCFAAQWALLLGGIARATGHATGLAVARVIVPLIVVAEVCSWHAVLTTSNLGHVIEESLWGLAAALLVTSLVIVWPHCRREARPLLTAACVLGAGYVAYMFFVDVPMYWGRWIADLEQGRPLLGIAQGLADASSRWVVSHRWEDWRSEVLWMSLYFSVAVWASIALVHATLIVGPAREATREPGGRAGMKSSSAFSLLRVVRATQFSTMGLRSAWRDEAAFRLELALAVVMVPLTLWLPLPRLSTVLLLALMALVLITELLNSGIEAVVDKTTPELHHLAAKAKDCGSAAVFVALVTFAGAWLALAGPAFWESVTAIWGSGG